jgi:hypothetical protein
MGKKLFSLISMVTMAAALMFGYVNCGGVTSAFDGSTVASSTAGWTFSYTPNPLYVGGTAVMAVSGGTAPYTYSLYYGSGSVSTGVYYSSAEGYATIQVTDASGASQTFTIYSYPASSSSAYTTSAPTNIVYRFFGSTKHFFSLSSTEGLYVGMVLEMAAFRVLVYNQSANTLESLYGYAYTYPATNTKPLYSFYSLLGDYLVTTNYAEGAGNGAYIYSGVIGYTPLQ